MNNFEKIKEMSVDEIASVILQQDFCDKCIYDKEGICTFVNVRPTEPLYNGCKEACLNWLLSEAGA